MAASSGVPSLSVPNAYPSFPPSILPIRRIAARQPFLSSEAAPKAVRMKLAEIMSPNRHGYVGGEMRLGKKLQAIRNRDPNKYFRLAILFARAFPQIDRNQVMKPHLSPDQKLKAADNVFESAAIEARAMVRHNNQIARKSFPTAVPKFIQ